MAKFKSKVEEIAHMTGLKKWKVEIVLGNNASNNIHRVPDEEVAIILHAAADIGYVNQGRGVAKGTKVKEVTIAQVAKRAGVSASTVREALLAKSVSISNETRSHVMVIVKELGYKPTHKTNIKNFYNKGE